VQRAVGGKAESWERRVERAGERVAVSVVIPTYQREQVLLETVQVVLNQVPSPQEILIVDQSPEHETSVAHQLQAWHDEGRIRWARLTEPSIPKSMNYGLRLATRPVVLFLDDDLTAASTLVDWHWRTHQQFSEAVAVVGQVLQPGEVPRDAPVKEPRTGLRADLEFPFFRSEADWISNVMAGNLSVNRDYALKIGGFDENFIGVAYRFETEFARRLIAGGGKIRFCPEASINHLRAERGGTRSGGSHLTSADPKYGIGDHYYAFLHGHPGEAWRYSIRRLFREVRTRFHLRHPWWIPVKLVGELRALRRGWKMAREKSSIASRQSAANTVSPLIGSESIADSNDLEVEHTS
jgi:GT2 family glycosyltransferase